MCSWAPVSKEHTGNTTPIRTKVIVPYMYIRMYGSPLQYKKNGELEVIFSPFQFLIFLQAVAKEVRHFYSGLMTKVLKHTTSVS